MASTTPKVSIGMPVYNGEPFICEALDSLLAQTFTDFELIISDNASTDGTEGICREYAAKDLRIRYVRQNENHGAAANFQFVLDEAVGEYFMWAAADDVWRKDWVYCLCKAFSSECIGVLGGIVGFVNEWGNESPYFIRNFKRNSLFLYYMTPESSGKCIYIYSLFNRQKLLQVDINLLNTIPYWSDALFVFDCLRHGNLKTIRSTVSYRRNHESNSGKVMWSKYYGWKRILFSAYPWVYHKAHLDRATGVNKTLILIGIPFKHVLEQSKIWLRGIKAILFDHQHFIGRVRYLHDSRPIRSIGQKAGSNDDR